MNNTYKFSLPNDSESEADDAARIEAGQDYEDVAIVCKSAGLRFVAETDHGAEWAGTPEQFGAAVAALPAWAVRYASKVE